MNFGDLYSQTKAVIDVIDEVNLRTKSTVDAMRQVSLQTKSITDLMLMHAASTTDVMQRINKLQIEKSMYVSNQLERISLYSSGLSSAFSAVNRLSNQLQSFATEASNLQSGALRAATLNTTMSVKAVQNHVTALALDSLLKDSITSMDGYQSKVFLDEMESIIEEKNLKEEFIQEFSSPNVLSTSEFKNTCYRVAFSLFIILSAATLTEEEIQDAFKFIVKAIETVASMSTIVAATTKTKSPEPIEIHHHHYHRKEEESNRDSDT